MKQCLGLEGSKCPSSKFAELIFAQYDLHLPGLYLPVCLRLLALILVGNNPPKLATT